MNNSNMQNQNNFTQSNPASACECSIVPLKSPQEGARGLHPYQQQQHQQQQQQTFNGSYPHPQQQYYEQPYQQYAYQPQTFNGSYPQQQQPYYQHPSGGMYNPPPPPMYGQQQQPYPSAYGAAPIVGAGVPPIL